jgi:type IV secretory pathway TrbF-like protein
MTTPLPHHLVARTFHETRWDRLARARENWRIAAAILIALQVFQAVVIWQLATRAQVQTYVIEVDRFGQPRFAGPVKAKDLPEDKLWRWTLSRFIHDLRTVPTSPEHLSVQLLYSSAFLRGEAMTTVKQYFDRHNPFLVAKTTSVVVEPQVTVLRRGKHLWQLEWTEIHTDLSGQRHQERWQALATTFQSSPSLKRASTGPQDDLQYLNPLGLYVTELDWSLVRTSTP